MMETDLKLNETAKKWQTRKKLIVFLGRIILSKVIDFPKTEAITKMPLPRSVSKLQRFFGTGNDLEKFISYLSKYTTTLDPIRFYYNDHKQLKSIFNRSINFLASLHPDFFPAPPKVHL